MGCFNELQKYIIDGAVGSVAMEHWQGSNISADLNLDINL